jgi:cation diffusion facilitator CzcD-associated flavoprotein CzcO
MMCAGYYKYAEGYLPDWENMAAYKGVLAHPQFWPDDLDYAGKRVLVIGSGATAVTIVPEMAKDAAHVTMLQRSPTYMASRPAEDAFALWLRKVLPEKLAYGVTRWRNVLFQMFFFNLARKNPAKTKERLIEMVRAQLPDGYDVATHFTPNYNPWDQRLCLVPDNDMFAAISAGKASVVTDQIARFTETGVALKSGAEIAADVIVTATGLVLENAGGTAISVDGAPVEFGKTLAYKGMMYADVPNLASVFGYTNASWTLKADLTCEYVCRLLKYMDRHGYAQATPRNHDPEMALEPWLDFSSGYVRRAIDRLPKQGAKKPWKLYQNYAKDIVALRFGTLTDGAMEFRAAPARAAAPAPVRETADA